MIQEIKHVMVTCDTCGWEIGISEISRTPFSFDKLTGNESAEEAALITLKDWGWTRKETKRDGIIDICPQCGGR